MATSLGPLAIGGSRLRPSRLAAGTPLAARPAATRSGARMQRLRVSASKRLSEADLYQSVAPPQGPAPAAGGQPWYVTGALACVAVLAALRVAKALRKRLRGGNRLEERGFKRGGVADDRAYTNAIRSMRRVQYEELSDEQIQAARRRRQREVQKDMIPVDLDAIDLPENHPFAVKKQLAPEEEFVQQNRMQARRRLSEEDMRRLREQQALAEQMDAEEEARQAARRRQAGL